MSQRTKKQKTGAHIRVLTPDDAVIYLKIADDPLIWEHTAFLGASTPEKARNIISINNSRFCRFYGLFSKANRLMGVFTVYEIPESTGASLCYMIGKRYRGRGNAVLGIRLLKEKLENTFSYFDFSVGKRNESSLRVQQKLGSEKIGETRRYLEFRLR